MKVSITVGSTTEETTLESLTGYDPALNEPTRSKGKVVEALVDLFTEALQEEWARTTDQIQQAAKAMGVELP